MTKREEKLIERANARPSRISVTESENENELAIGRPPFGNVFSIKKDPSVIGLLVVVLVAILGPAALFGDDVSRFLQVSLPASFILIYCFFIAFLGIVLFLYWRRSYPPMRLQLKKSGEYSAWLYSQDPNEPDYTGDKWQLRMSPKEEWKTGWVKLTVSHEDEGEFAVYWVSHNDLSRMKEFFRKYNPISFKDDYEAELLANLHKEEFGDDDGAGKSGD